VISLASGIDIVNEKIKTKIDQMFQVNPEECRSYIMGNITYMSQKIQNTMIQSSPKELILGYKKIYSHLQPLSYQVGAEYAIGIAIAIRRTLQIPANAYTRILYAPILLITGRYLIMYGKRKHLPPLPIAREIRQTLTNIYTKIKNKIYPR
jgi:hypothetical protein